MRLITIISREYSNGEYEYAKINLYSHGSFDRTLIQRLPVHSLGPFEVSIKNNSCIFHVITTTDGVAPKKGETKEWNIYRYEDGSLVEIIEDLRSRGDDAYDAFNARGFNTSEIFCLKNEIIAWYGDGLYSITSNGKNKLFENEYEINPRIYKRFVDNKGRSAVLVSYDDKMYVYSEGTAKCLSDEVVSWLMFERNGEDCLLGCYYHLDELGNVSKYVLKLSLNDLDFDSVDKSIKKMHTANQAYGAVAYSDDKIIYGNGNRLFLWSGGRETTINETSYFKDNTRHVVILTDWDWRQY